MWLQSCKSLPSAPSAFHAPAVLLPSLATQDVDELNLGRKSAIKASRHTHAYQAGLMDRTQTWKACHGAVMLGALMQAWSDVPSCKQVKEIVEKGASSRVAAAEADEQLQVPGPAVAAGRCRLATVCGWILQLLSLPSFRLRCCALHASQPASCHSSRPALPGAGHVSVYGGLGHRPRHRLQVVRMNCLAVAAMHSCCSSHTA